MARNRYEEQCGVLRLRWESGWSGGDNVPMDRGPLLVEVWVPSLDFWYAMKPRVEVTARFETWVYRHGAGWHRVRHNGDLEPIAKMPMVRRWTALSGSRNWQETIALDGWGR